MQWQRFILASGLIAGLVVILTVGLWVQHLSSPEVQARKTLDRILEQLESGIPHPLPPSAMLWDEVFPQSLLLDRFSQDWDPFNLPNRLASTIQMPQIRVDETREAYIVKVPLSQPDDEKNVTLKVEPHFISVSAQLPLRTPDGKNILGSSSVMKSLHTRQEVLPAKLSRNVSGNTLVVTIPKKDPDEAYTAPTGPLPGQKQQQPAPSNLQRQLQGEPQSFI